MIVLRALSTEMAGQETVARHFPFQVGRGGRDDLRVEAPGVWEGHFAIERGKGQPLTLRANPAAITLVNGRQVAEAELRNGDVIEAGAAKFQFWLSPVRQKALALRESLTWLGLVALAAFQVFIILTLN